MIVLPGHGHKGIATIHLAHHDASATQVAIKRINLDQWDQEFTYIQVSRCATFMSKDSCSSLLRWHAKDTGHFAILS